MIEKKENERIARKFGLIRIRQLVAVIITFCVMVILAVLSKSTDLFGHFSKNSISAVQILIIVAFINFSAWNWRCPSCKNYLGHDIMRRFCKKCGTRLG